MIAALTFFLATIAIPPTPTHYVTDNVHILSASASANLESDLHAFEKKTGDQILVWVGDSTGGTPLEDWTSRVAQAWKIGHKGKDNGAVLFFFMRDHKVRIEVGYGLEPILTDAQAANVINNYILPEMKRDHPSVAIREGVDETLSIIDPAFTPPSAANPVATASSEDDTVGEVIVFLVLLLIGAALLFGLIVTIVRGGKKHGDWLDALMFVGGSGGSSGSFFSSGGGFGGGGGFSAGGGSFGGGGASGGW